MCVSIEPNHKVIKIEYWELLPVKKEPYAGRSGSRELSAVTGARSRCMGVLGSPWKHAHDERMKQHLLPPPGCSRVRWWWMALPRPLGLGHCCLRFEVFAWRCSTNKNGRHNESQTELNKTKNTLKEKTSQTATALESLLQIRTREPYSHNHFQSTWCCPKI